LGKFKNLSIHRDKEWEATLLDHSRFIPEGLAETSQIFHPHFTKMTWLLRISNKYGRVARNKFLMKSVTSFVATAEVVATG
jgi:hypothetical protein